jgi:hypothetical protein
VICTEIHVQIPSNSTANTIQHNTILSTQELLPERMRRMGHGGDGQDFEHSNYHWLFTSMMAMQWSLTLAGEVIVPVKGNSSGKNGGKESDKKSGKTGEKPPGIELGVRKVLGLVPVTRPLVPPSFPPSFPPSSGPTAADNDSIKSDSPDSSPKSDFLENCDEIDDIDTTDDAANLNPEDNVFNAAFLLALKEAVNPYAFLGVCERLVHGHLERGVEMLIEDEFEEEIHRWKMLMRRLLGPEEKEEEVRRKSRRKYVLFMLCGSFVHAMWQVGL